jgi:pilin isopeptide linkage protein/LPXTG-motif cell wall-anchored protein
VKFGDITFVEEGTYTFTMKELNGGLENITYDDSEFTVTVKVTDEDGQLVADVSVDGGKAKFINTYVPPEEPEEPEEGANTGDNSNLLAGLLAMTLSALGIAGAFFFRRREQN